MRIPQNRLNHDSVTIEFTRDNRVVESCEVSQIAWHCFKLVAAKAGFKAEEYFAIAIAGCLQDGMDLRRAVEWLLPSEEQTIEAQALEVSLS